MILNKGIPLKYVLGKVKYDLVYVLVIALLVYYLTHMFDRVLPEMPITIPAFLGTAISILLSFKLNQSYDRWWEARKIWGSIVNDSRSLVLQLQMLLPKGNEDIVKRIAYRQIAWCYSLSQSLRSQNPVANLSQFLSDNELERISEHQNKPLALLQQHALDLKALHENKQTDSYTQVQFNNTLMRFSDWMGMAERIKNTVFPATYRLFLHGVIYLFIVTLSVALRDIESYFEIPLLMIIASAFFLLEKSATHMQDPFSNKPTDTPMSAVSRTIEINIKQLLREEQLPEPMKPESFYMM